MPPPHFIIDRKQFRRGNWLAGLGAALALLPMWTVNLLFGQESGGAFVLATVFLGLALVIAAAFVIGKASRCPHCERRWGRDVIPHSVISHGGVFYCNHCGAEIRIE